MSLRKGMAAAICLILAGCIWIAGCGTGKQDTMETGISEPDAVRPEEQALSEPGKETPAESRDRKEKRQLRSSIEGLLVPWRLVVEAYGGSCEAIPVQDGSMEVLVPVEFAEQVLEIGVLEYPDSQIILQQGNDWVKINSEEGEKAAYLPLRMICEKFGYQADMALGSGTIELKDTQLYRRRGLPSAYDYREAGRSTKVRDQGSYGTCWSFASLTAMETTLRPMDSKELSADHMSLHNGFSLNQREGGEYTMSMAYLLAWQGPVLEEEDPYGDGVSPEGLKPVVHVQEIQILPSKDYKAIKKAVFLNGGVQSSLYTSITDSQSRSIYYNEETNAYCYQGDRIPNHDIVIVGWDDQYPKENFQTEAEGDGAFLCVSSWGEAFGEEGYFYVSYYDSNIGSNNLAYTKIEATDNYDRIYQSDLCGWVGQVGYGKEKAFGANIYKAEDWEELKAVGFYAIGDSTSYTVYLSHQTEEGSDFQDRHIIAQGTIPYSGFYTISLEVPEKLEPGKNFAVILEIETPGAEHPLAVEYQADDATKDVDVTDGQGYISSDGIRWEPMESRYQCNLCLKAYTEIDKSIQLQR